jgi:hypothetical protein
MVASATPTVQPGASAPRFRPPPAPIPLRLEFTQTDVLGGVNEFLESLYALENLTSGNPFRIDTYLSESNIGYATDVLIASSTFNPGGASQSFSNVAPTLVGNPNIGNKISQTIVMSTTITVRDTNLVAGGRVTAARNPVPEPHGLALAAIGLIALLATRRRPGRDASMCRPAT